MHPIRDDENRYVKPEFDQEIIFENSYFIFFRPIVLNVEYGESRNRKNPADSNQ